MPKLNLNLPTIVAALCGSVFFTACPGDDTGGTGTDTEADSTSTGPSVTTMPPPTTNPPDDTTTTGDTTTVGLDDTSTTGTPDDTTSTGPDDTTSTGDDTTGTTGTTGETGSTTDEPPPAMGYGDCANFEEAVACLADEICIGTDQVGVCSEQECADAADCPVPATGTAVVMCVNITTEPEMIPDCILDCSMGETCPDDMVCFEGAGVCVWELEAPPPPPPGICPDEDLGNTVPQMVMGDNTGLGEDWEPSCATGGEDSTYQFTAPAADTYVFSTAGSMGDTVLSVLEACAGPEIACNDDAAPMDLTSEVTLALAAGQSVIIVVDGFGGGTGPFNLSVTAM